MDVTTLRLVVAALGLVSVLCTCGLVLLACLGHEPPPALVAVAANAVGSLVGILVTTKPNGQNNGQK